MGKQGKKKKKPTQAAARELIFKDEEQEYGVITNILGDFRYDVNVPNTGKDVRGRLRGSIRRKTRITLGDCVLFSYRDYDEKTVDIIHAYKDDERTKLMRYGEIQKPKEEDETVNGVEISFDEI
jgi:initiation factor 1A